MRILTPEECETAERVVLKALSAIHARQRFLRWKERAPTMQGVKRQQAQMRMQLADAKTHEDLAEFRAMKAEAEGCHG